MKANAYRSDRILSRNSLYKWKAYAKNSSKLLLMKTRSLFFESFTAIGFYCIFRLKIYDVIRLVHNHNNKHFHHPQNG